MILNRKHLTLFAAVLPAASVSAIPGPGTHYATDAYLGFDSEAGILATPQKEPGLFWWSGPKMETPSDQLAWARACEADDSIRAARKAYEALVAQWPSAPEAAVAQKALADLEYGKARDYIQAFAEYKYLLDFYSAQCDYDAIAARRYETAKRMREAGKRIMFFPFANTTDVRRAFEAVVRRAPGAPYVAEAMLTVGELREEEGYYERAIEVYENLRNRYAGTPEAKVALKREAAARMKVLSDHPYNRSRCQDTIAFLKMAQLSGPDSEFRTALTAWLAEANALIEDEAYAAAKFYDSRTRTRRSAINAYERFLNEYPAGVHADEARARLLALQQEEK